MFSFRILKGNPDKLFKSAAEVFAVTEQVARRYFGDEEPLGKTIEFENGVKKLFTVLPSLNHPRPTQA